MQQDGLVYRDMREAIDGDQIVDFFCRHSLDVMKEIVKCPTCSKQWWVCRSVTVARTRIEVQGLTEVHRPGTS